MGFTLDELLENRLLEIPEPNQVFPFKEVVGRYYKGLHLHGGNYIIKDGQVIIYTGVTKNLGQRLSEHRSSSNKATLRGKLITKGMTKDEAMAYISTLTVEVIYQTKLSHQDIIEKYLIEIYKPEFNTDGIGEERAGSANRTINLPDVEILDLYNNGFPTTDIAKKYNVSYQTISKRLNDLGIEISKSKSSGVDKAMRLVKENKLSSAEIMAITGISKTAFYRNRKRIQALA